MIKKRIIRCSILLAVSAMAFMGLSKNLFAWTDTVTAGSTKIRSVHISEMRTVVDAKRADYGFSAYSWTDSSLTAGTSKVRAIHVTDLRTAIDAIRSVYNPICPSTVTTASGGWTDTITAGTTKIRGVHITQLRTAIDSVGSCKACAQAVHVCRTCGVTGLNNQTSGDLWNDCAVIGTPTCQTGNCDGAGNCATDPQTCYTDGDGDGQGAGASSIICTSCGAGKSTNVNDCCDADANVKLGQTLYFQTARSASCSPAGGYDYDCGGAGSIQVDPADTATLVSNTAWGCDTTFNDCAFHASYSIPTSACGATIRYGTTKNAGSTCSAGTTQCAPTNGSSLIVGCH